MEYEELTEKIIGAAIHVHKELGPGFVESIYENALCIELSLSKLNFRRQKIVPIYYRDEQIGEHRLDLVVENLIVVELKAAKALENIHFTQVRSYLKAIDKRHGLLLNFATMPLTIKRVLQD